MMDIFIEKVAINHSKLIWEWRNDLETRQMSLNGEIIDWESHNEWYTKTLNDMSIYFYMGKTLDKNIGIIRFERNKKDFKVYKVSINIAPNMRGKGLAKKFLKKGIQKFLFDNKSANYLEAEIKISNERSYNLFLKTGFEKINSDYDNRNILRLKL
tara:strand:- start:186 stop:653 length:468 start_codon:yes stop_codon:yes gene_type:complete